MKQLVQLLVLVTCSLSGIAQDRSHAISFGLGKTNIAEDINSLEIDLAFTYKNKWFVKTGSHRFSRTDPSVPTDWNKGKLKESCLTAFAQAGCKLPVIKNRLTWNVSGGFYKAYHIDYFDFQSNPDFEEKNFEGDPFDLEDIVLHLFQREEPNYLYQEKRENNYGLQLESSASLTLIPGLSVEAGLRYLDRHPVSSWNKMFKVRASMGF